MNLQLMAVVGIALPFLLVSLMIPVLVIVLLVKLVRCCVSGRVRILPIVILCVVAAIFFNRARSVPGGMVATMQNDPLSEKNAGQILIGQSGAAQVESTLCATTADADNEACNAATDLLLPHVKAAMEPPIASSAMLRSIATDEWIKNQIKSSVSRGVGITNRQVDRIDRPYGTLWKETLDLDISPDAIERNFAAPSLQLAEAQSEGRRNEWASLAGLIGVIFLLYSFLNSATKGYFVWRLRAVATLVLIAAVLAIFALV